MIDCIFNYVIAFISEQNINIDEDYFISPLLLFLFLSYLRIYWQIQGHEHLTLFSSKGFYI